MANMNASPYNHIVPYLPNTWCVGNTPTVQKIGVPSHTQEYRDVTGAFTTHTIRKVDRHQNVNQYGLFLVRQQHLQALNTNTNYVKVTRYCTISQSSLEDALKFNLDQRRLSETVTLSCSPKSAYSVVTLVLSCVVSEDQFGVNNIEPTRDADWYIEYIVYI